MDVKHMVGVGTLNFIFTAWGISPPNFFSEKMTILLW